MADLYIGLMSGTSLDGVDAVLARFPGSAAIEVIGHLHQPFEPVLREELLALNSPGDNEAHRCALAANGMARAYAQLVHALLRQSGRGPADVRALGAHGQTIRHRPGEFDGNGYTLQLLNGALLAELSGIDVVCDLRGRDVAAGGQGAPLVPAFHRALFARPDADIAVLNIGG
ncbi:MAG TPA: anhydro-N-acetylmuramic acid kinase, partial [Roseateles sp.]|nr:anhydro-N-acetylmuramic acid kinase [Roseateles sp.]